MKSCENSDTILDRAQKLVSALRSEEIQKRRGRKTFTIKGIDSNELKKIYSHLCKYNDLQILKELLEKLPDSKLAKRTGSTSGYFKNINSAFRREGIYNLDVEEAKQVIGWACRLYTKSQGRSY